MVATTRETAVQGWASAREVRRRFIPALPTLWPGMLSPLASEQPPAFPLGAPRVSRFYFARNAVFHAARLLGLEGREVLVPAYHHGVEISALTAAGAAPRFVRVDGRMRLDLEDLEAKLSARTAAIYVIHYAGFPQPIDDVMALARRAGVPVIEDCALSLLSADGVRPLGSTGAAGVFCFYKTLPVPNGGALVVNDPALAGELGAPLGAPLASTLSHAAGSLLSNAALRFGDAGELLRAGLRRHLQQYPSVREGLSRTEVQTLRALPDSMLQAERARLLSKIAALERASLFLALTWPGSFASDCPVTGSTALSIG